MDYIVGVSSANNITNVSIATLRGIVVQSFTVGAINYFFADESQIEHNLAEIFVTAQMAGFPVRSCRQICAGVAGIQANDSFTKLIPTLRGVIRRCGYSGDALLVGDEAVALAGALGGAKGAILMADTASVCFGQNGMGRQHKTGGMGLLADDDGSGYAIGREILRAVARASDGRGPATRLTAAVYNKLKLAGSADFAKMMREASLTAEEICELSFCLPQACQAMDKVALGIVEDVSDQLVNLTVPVIERLAMQKGTLAVAGRVLLNDAFVGISFKKKMNVKYPELQCVPPRNDGTAGAVLLAKERLALRGFS